MAILESHTIGILGGGQLARMFCLEAHNMGFNTVVYSPEHYNSSSQVCSEYIQGDWSDANRLKEFGDKCNVITFEFENIPVETLNLLPVCKVRPHTQVIKICQDRILEKSFCQNLKIPTAPWKTIADLQQLEQFCQIHNYQCVLKTTTLGYDGHGQAVISQQSHVEQAYNKLSHQPLICEKKIKFVYELSMIVARNSQGDIQYLDPSVNHHRDQILYQSIVGMDLEPEILSQAQAHAISLANGLDVVGLLAVEMFVLESGEVLVNELAPRPHNSGHWSMDGCIHSQFNLHIRAITGMPLLTPHRHSNVVMQNLVGYQAQQQFQQACGWENVRPHWYSKKQATPGRKMGHINKLYPLDHKLQAKYHPLNLGT